MREIQKKGWVLVRGSVAKEQNVRRGQFERDALNVYVFQLWVTSHPEVGRNGFRRMKDEGQISKLLPQIF